MPDAAFLIARQGAAPSARMALSTVGCHGEGRGGGRDPYMFYELTESLALNQMPCVYAIHMPSMRALNIESSKKNAPTWIYCLPRSYLLESPC